MTDDPITPLEADLDWVRRTLAPGDPLGPSDRQFVSIPASITDPPRLGRPRRGSTPVVVVTAMVAAVALILGVIALTVGGPGEGTHPPTGGIGPAAVLAAYSTTVGAQSAQVSASFSVDGTSVTVNGTGDLRTDQAVLTVELPAPFGQIEVRSTGQDYFVHMPPQLKGVAGGKPWVRIDRGTLQALAGSQLGVPGLGTTLDFSNVLAWLRGVSGQITTVGNESIHGTETTHYRAQVDLSRVAATMGADANDDSALAPSDGRTLPIDVWIDPQGRLRQLKVSLDLNTLPLPQGVTLPTQALGTAVLTVDLWNFGVTVHAVPPPANQVSDASSLIGGGAGRAG
ncbi:MAG TPA: hypothetical protein VLX59_17405 [Acidimicrobiales bacterium]|nr:hypothetical protein [Acidimicrobiales bacterium]